MGIHVLSRIFADYKVFPEVKYSDAVEHGEYLNFNGAKVVMSPFITGQGHHTEKNYKERLDITCKLIRNTLK